MVCRPVFSARMSSRNCHQTGCVSFHRRFSQINEPTWKRPASSPPWCRKQNASPCTREMLLNEICVRRTQRAHTRPSGLKLLDRAFCLWSLLRLTRTKGCPPVSIRFRFAQASLSLFLPYFFSDYTPLCGGHALSRVSKTARALFRQCFSGSMRLLVFPFCPNYLADETVCQPGTIWKSTSFCSNATRESSMHSTESREFRCWLSKVSCHGRKYLLCSNSMEKEQLLIIYLKSHIFSENIRIYLSELFIKCDVIRNKVSVISLR